MELPVSLCLLTSLETHDVHKNMITSLPVGIGNMKSLQKFDLSENKLTELPITICELFDDLQLSVGRNPLEKPSVEQARQGIGAIRRFGFSRSKGGDETATNAAATIKAKGQEGEAGAAGARGGHALTARLGGPRRRRHALQLQRLLV